MLRTLSLLSLIILISSCATTPQVERAYTTASGSAEVTVNASIDDISNYIVNDFVNANYVINSQTNNSLELQRPLKTSEEFLVGLTVGNSYSNNSRVSRFSFIKTQDGTRVIWKQFWKAEMVGGQVNQSAIDDNGLFNSNMEWLSEMKNSLE